METRVDVGAEDAEAAGENIWQGAVYLAQPTYQKRVGKQ